MNYFLHNYLHVIVLSQAKTLMCGILIFQHFDADRLGEPPEEDPSPGAVESDIMLTDEQKVALEESENVKTNTRTKRQGKAEVFFCIFYYILIQRIKQMTRAKTIFKS